MIQQVGRDMIAQLFAREVTDAFHPRVQVFAKGIQIRGTGEAAGHAHDRDRVVRPGFGVMTVPGGETLPSGAGLIGFVRPCDAARLGNHARKLEEFGDFEGRVQFS